MSSATGKVRFKDGTIKHFRYNGTCDWCVPCLFDTKYDLQENWRKEPNYIEGEYEWEDVIIAHTYAGGYWFCGKAAKSGWIHPDSLEVHYWDENDVLQNEKFEGLPTWYYDDE